MEVQISRFSAAKLGHARRTRVESTVFPSSPTKAGEPLTDPATASSSFPANRLNLGGIGGFNLESRHTLFVG